MYVWARMTKIGKSPNRLGNVLAVPAILLALAVILMVAIGLRSAARKSDQISVERQTREVWLALGAAQDDLAQSQTGIAIWNLALLELRRAKPDWGWFDSNVGEYLNYVFAHHADFILDERDRPAYGMMFGARVSPTRYSEFALPLAPLVEAVRGRIHVKPNPHERLPGARPNPRSTARTSPRARHATDLVLLNGRPAVVSIMRMIPDTKAVRDTPGREPLLVSIRYLDKAFARDLSRVKLIAAARIAATPHMAADERAIPLVSGRGQHLGFLIWKPELPGSALLASMAPTAVVAVALLIAVLALLALRLARTMRENTHALSLLETAHTDLEVAHAHLETAHAELQEKEALAHHRALHDSLTGLPNRVLFNDSVEQLLTEAGAKPRCAIMLLDLDRFKQVNDTLGHHAGDILIQQVAARLNVTIKPGDIAARLGGDEFAVLVRSCSSDEELEQLASSLVRSLRRPFYIQQSKAFVGVSIGIATKDCATSGRSEMMRRADLAMYQAKEGGRGGYRFFTIDMEERALLRSMLERDFRDALSVDDQLFIEFQPRVAASKQRLVGCEALVRWNHPRNGLIPPQEFIPIAEDIGLIERLGLWVLEKTCAVARDWPLLTFSVNLSPTQLRNPAFPELVRNCVRSAGVEPHQIEFEITEGVLLADDRLSLAALADLRGQGFTVSLDDFGTGFSSLSYLTKFKVDKIKIDRSFTEGLASSTDAPAVICAVVSLGRALGLVVVAEGVETAEQCDFLSAAGCDELQGFFFSPPLKKEQLPALLNGDEAAESEAPRGYLTH